MTSPKAVIAEDEPVLRAELKRELAALWPELTVCAEAEEGVAALHAIEKHRPDVLFLDIQMPGMSGLEVAQQVNGRCHIAFVTAYDAYAVAAFDQGAVDYVMKPFSTARLAKAVARLQGEAGQRTPASARRHPAHARERLEHGEGASALDHRVARQRARPHHRRRDLLLPRGRQVHARRDGHRRHPDPRADQGTDRRGSTRTCSGRSTAARSSTSTRSPASRGRFDGHLAVRLKQRKETLPVSESYVHLFKSM